MSLTDGKRRLVTKEVLARNWGGLGHDENGMPRDFRCRLCKKPLQEGDYFRWAMLHDKDFCNVQVCHRCDDPNQDNDKLLARLKEDMKVVQERYAYFAADWVIEAREKL